MLPSKKGKEVIFWLRSFSIKEYLLVVILISNSNKSQAKKGSYFLFIDGIYYFEFEGKSRKKGK
jgi:hypothetical protein